MCGSLGRQQSIQALPTCLSDEVFSKSNSKHLIACNDETVDRHSNLILQVAMFRALNSGTKTTRRNIKLVIRTAYPIRLQR